MLLNLPFPTKPLRGLWVMFLFLPLSSIAQNASQSTAFQIQQLKWWLNIAPQKDTLRISRLNKIAQLYLKSQPDTAFLYAKQALQLSQKLTHRAGMAASQFNLGQVYYSYSNFNQATNQFLAALKLYQQIQHKKGEAQVHNALGQVYYYSSQMPTARKAHQQALKLYQQLKDKRGEAESLGFIGHIFEKKSDYTQALAFQQSALKIYEALDDKTGLSKIYDNIGSIYEDQAKYDQAFRYFNKAYETNKALNNQLEMVVNLNDLGDTYRKQGNYEKALSHTQQSYELAKKLNQKYQMRSALRDLSKTYVFLKDYKKAHELMAQSYEMYTEIFDEESARQIARMQTLYETSQKEKQIAVLEKDQKIALIYRYFFGGGTLMLLIIGWVIFRQQRHKIKNNREMMEQNQRIYETQQTLVQTELQNAHLNEEKLKAELENKQLKEQNLQAELEAKSKELTSHGLHIIQKNKMLEDLKDRLWDIKRQGKKDANKQIQQAINMINYSFSMDKDWEDFKKVFEEVHQGFFVQLQEQYPDLTPAETRLCALIKLNLKPKDIAAIMGISQDSLRIARYRLRKKLQLAKETKLNNFVVNIG